MDHLLFFSRSQSLCTEATKHSHLAESQNNIFITDFIYLVDNFSLFNLFGKVTPKSIFWRIIILKNELDQICWIDLSNRIFCINIVYWILSSGFGIKNLYFKWNLFEEINNLTSILYGKTLTQRLIIFISNISLSLNHLRQIPST